MSDIPLLFEIAVEPKSKADAQTFESAISDLSADARFRVMDLADSAQIILCGVSERALAERIALLQDACKFGLNVGQPQVAYRETISKTEEVDYTHKKLSGRHQRSRNFFAQRSRRRVSRHRHQSRAFWWGLSRQ